MLENLTQPTMAIDHISTEEDYDYGQIGKGVLHAFIIPFALAFADPAYSLVYLLCAAFLYSTVFRHKSSGFWGTIVFIITMAAMMIVPN